MKTNKVCDLPTLRKALVRSHAAQIRQFLQYCKYQEQKPFEIGSTEVAISPQERKEDQLGECNLCHCFEPP